MPSEKALDRAQWQAARAFRTSYARRLDEGADVAGSYQAVYQKSRRTICSWIEQARYNWIAAGMPGTGPAFPPLDQPARMHGWWVENMKNAAPAILAELASGRAVTPAASISRASTSEGVRSDGVAGDFASGTARQAGEHGAIPSPSAAGGAGHAGSGPATGSAGDTSEAMTIEQAYEAQTRYVAAACRRYDEAARRTNPPATSVELKTLAEERNKTIETLRALKRDMDRAAVEQGRLISLPQIHSELAPCLEAIAAAFVRTLRDDAGIEPRRARQMADACFADLRASRFSLPAPTHAPPLAA